MFDPEALPCVGHVNQSVACLNDGWITVFSRFAFQNQGGTPLFAVSGNSDIQRTAAQARVVVH